MHPLKQPLTDNICETLARMVPQICPIVLPPWSTGVAEQSVGEYSTSTEYSRQSQLLVTCPFAERRERDVLLR